MNLNFPKNRLFLGFTLLFLPIFFPEKFFFNSFVPFLYKILIIGGILLTGSYFSKLLKIRFLFFLIVCVFIEISIFSIFILLKNGVELPTVIKNNFKDFYMASMRDAPPYNFDLGQYDESLFYKLKSGNHQFSNLEFSTQFKVNSLGVRDEENSLHFPKMVCIGDSFTMGWGVEQNESFPEIIEQKTKSKTLNMGIPSFGTAREFLFLKKIQLDSCKLLMLQFCENDLIENRSFIENNFTLKVSTKKKYASAQQANYLQSNYYPFKFCFEFTAKKIRSIFGFSKKNQNHSLTINEKGIDDFFKIVALIQEIYDGKIVLFNLESNLTTDEYFQKFKNFLDKNPNEKIILFNASKVLEENDYFRLDDHLNKTGHQKIANGILKLMEEKLATN